LQLFKNATVKPPFVAELLQFSCYHPASNIAAAARWVQQTCNMAPAVLLEFNNFGPGCFKIIITVWGERSCVMNDVRTAYVGGLLWKFGLLHKTFLRNEFTFWILGYR
jgi:hypothetical protein